MTVFYGYGDTPETAINHVCALKDHPAIAGWLVGNEWNLNMLGRNVGSNEAADAVEQVIRAVRMNGIALCPPYMAGYPAPNCSVV